MSSPIQKFYTVAQNRDFARTFQFRLVQFGNIEFDSNHFAYVETASLPGRQITNVPVPFMGLDFNTPATVKYPGSASYSVVFRCDQNYNIRAALEASTFQLFDESTSRGTYGVPGEDSKLIMELFDKQMRTVRTYTLFGVWVQQIQDGAYDVKDQGSVLTVQATLAYQYWRAADYTARSAPQESSIPFALTNPSVRMFSNGTKQGYVAPPSWGGRAV